jgi:RNA polymerase sigma-70 factor (ECF subfamily)
MDATKPRTLTEMESAAAPETFAGTAGESPEVTALVERAREGDAEAFADLMRLFERRVITLGLQIGLSRDDALDACQDSFVKVFKYIRRFETGRSFFKWLYRIALHAIYDQLRRSRRSQTVSLDDIEADSAGRLAAEEPSIHDHLEVRQMAARVRESLDCLTRRERIVFVLRDLQEMSSEEVGVILRLSQVTVRRHSMSARQKLRRRLFPPQT